MKRIIFLSIVTLFAISNYAQIEGFDESELNTQLSKKERVVFDKSKILFTYENELYVTGKCDIRNQKLYSIDFNYIEHNVKPKKFILFMDSTKTTLGIDIYKAGEYYRVVDILITEEEVTQLQEEMSSCKFIGDTVYYKEISSNAKPKKFTITRKDLRSYPFANYYYVLKKDNDSKYYFVTSQQGSIVNTRTSYNVLGVFPEIGNFITITGLTQMKAKYEEKLLCKKTKYGVDTTQLFICKKIAPKDGVLQGLFENISTQDNTFSTISGHDSFVTENLDHDTLSVLYTGHGGYCLKHEIDSILHRKEVLRQEKERKEKLETLAEQKRIIETYGETFGKLIIDGKVCVGMTKAMCIEALGSPCQKNSYTDKYDKTEVWTYYCYFVENGWMDNLMFVTFIDGKVTSITE